MTEQPNPVELAERVVLGSTLTCPDSAETVIRIVGEDPERFTLPEHQRIYAAMLRTREDEERITAAGINDALLEDGEFQDRGGLAYLHRLIQDADHRTVHHHARRLTFAHSPLSNDQVGWIDDVLPHYIDVLEDPGKASRPTVDVHFAGLAQGLPWLEPGTLTVISGRPGVGKTSLLANIACTTALEQVIPTLWVDQESPRQSVIDRIISAQALVPLHTIRARVMDVEDWERVAQAISRLAWAPLALHTGTRVDIDQVDQMARESGAGLVAIDGLQHLKTFPERETREREVSDITRALKDLALELDVPVVVTAHLNRASLYRPEAEPTLDDLRESDLIAHLADTVILIDRPETRTRDSWRAGEADLKVVKHRNGPTFDVTVAFQSQYCRFVDMIWD